MRVSDVPHMGDVYYVDTTGQNMDILISLISALATCFPKISSIFYLDLSFEKGGRWRILSWSTHDSVPCGNHGHQADFFLKFFICESQDIVAINSHMFNKKVQTFAIQFFVVTQRPNRHQ